MIRDFRLGNRAWRRAREKEWTRIRRRIRDQDNEFSSREWLDTLGSYYLTGKRPTFERDFAYIPLLYRMAFHPTSTAEDWTKMCAECSVVAIKKAKSGCGFSPGWREEEPFFGDKDQALRDFFFPAEPRTIVAKNGEVPVWFYQTYGFEEWWSSIAFWLTKPCPGQWPLAIDTLDWMWERMPASIEDERTCGVLRDVMMQCAHFVPPIGLRGDDIPQKRFAAQLRDELSARELPSEVQKLWSTMQTRKGRSRLWDRRLLYGGEPGYDVTWGFENLVLFDVPCTQENLQRVQSCLFELGFTSAVELEDPEPVELRNHVTTGFARQLGYEANEPLGAWRVRVHTTPDYVDSDRERIDLDLLALSPRPLLGKNVPTLLLVPRPLRRYDEIEFALAYNLNVNLFRRTYEAQTGHVLKTYGPKTGWTVEQMKRAFPPFFKAQFQPLTIGSEPLVDDPEHDFPIWEGPALAPLPER